MKTKLIDEISNRKTLIKAWKGLSKRPFSYGFDKVTIQQFRESLDSQIDEIQIQLKDGTYKFSPLRLYMAEKKDGGYRPIKIPTVRDRVVQKAVYDTIYSHLDKKYKINNPASYAYIKSRKIEDVAKKVLELRDDGYRYCCKTDIVKFFEKVDKQRLLKLIDEALPDKTIKGIIENAVENDISNADFIHYERKTGQAYKYDTLTGIAQGSPLSPMFANLFLCDFDAYMLKKDYKLIRYADDMLIVTKSISDATDAYRSASSFLSKIKLELYKLRDDVPGELWKKDGKYSYVRTLENVEFLGLRFSSGKVYPANSSYKNVMKEIRGVAYSRSISLVKKVQSLSSRIEGWSNAFRYTTEEPKRLEHNDIALEDVLTRMLEKHNLVRIKNSISATNTLGLVTLSRSSSMARKDKTTKKNSNKHIPKKR